jgi:DNA-binding transcriptional regulator LsrR (DeoR family)
VSSILTGAASGYFNQLVTDAHTALALIDARDG